MLFLLLLLSQAGPSARGDMDYGPFLTYTLARAKTDKDKDVIAYKGINIRLENGGVCFDPERLCMAAGWTGGFLDLSGTIYTINDDGVSARVGGKADFQSTAGRSNGRYSGLYLHGHRVILSYSIDECPLLLSPAAEGLVFHARPSARSISIVLWDAKDAPVPTLVEGPGGSSIKNSGGHWTLSLPPRSQNARFAVGWNPSSLPAVVDLATMCAGGPARWGNPMRLKGSTGRDDVAYTLDTLPVPEENPWKSWMRLTGLDFFADGRAAISTLNGDVFVVSGIGDRLEDVQWKRFATGLYQPLGLRIVDGIVYVRGRDQITKLHDLNGDGEADFYENFNNDGSCLANYQDFAFDLQTDPDGNFYYARNGNSVAPSVPMHGCIIRVSKDGTKSEIVATGFRAAAGLGVGPRGEMTASDQQGQWTPASRLSWIKPGGFYGYVPHSGRKEAPSAHDPPLCWIPHGVDNSSAGQVWVTSDRWGLLKGQLLHLSYGMSSLFHVLRDPASDPVQGAVVRFPLTFASGVFRARFNPTDGQLYLVGLRGWQTNGARDGSFQRVRFTGKPARTTVGFKVVKSGVELTFTDPLDRTTAEDSESYGVQGWNYAWTEQYGSPDLSLTRPGKQGRDPLDVRSAKLSADGRSLTLELSPFAPMMQLRIQMKCRAADGSPMSLDLYGTVHRVP